MTRMRALEILAPGLLATIQDQGRRGYLYVGVSHSGAADRAAHALGARLLGNLLTTAAIEVTLGGLTVRARGQLDLALTGAPAPATIDSRPAAHASRLTLHDGQVLTLGTPVTAMRTYVSVRGGIDVTPVLGSRSTDTMAGLGPPPLRPGDILPVGVECATALPATDHAPYPTQAEPPEVLTIGTTRGPRSDWFDTDLTTTPWRVTDRLDRAGIRLTGDRLVGRREAYRSRELASEGMVPGAIQVPPSGEPVIFGPDHPVTGGYPVIAVVSESDLDRVAQLRPGDVIRFGTSQHGLPLDM